MLCHVILRHVMSCYCGLYCVMLCCVVLQYPTLLFLEYEQEKSVFEPFRFVFCLSFLIALVALVDMGLVAIVATPTHHILRYTDGN